MGKLAEHSLLTSNFGVYYLAFARVYSLYMLTTYFELFGRYMKPGKANRDAVAEIRKNLLLEPRWPEIVTFEEMNLKVPDEQRLERFVIRVYNAGRGMWGFLRRLTSP